MTHVRGALVLVAVSGLILFQSVNGRQRVIDEQRADCYGFARTVLVPMLNLTRADEEGNASVASDPRQPARTRNARAREVEVEKAALVFMDQRLDENSTAGLNPTGLAIVARLKARHVAFSCRRAYPDTSLF